MRSNTLTDDRNPAPGVKSGVAKWLRRVVFASLLLATFLFVSSGRLNWVWAWALIAVYVSFDSLTALILIPRNPALLAERSQVQKGTKSWDMVISILTVGLLPMTSWVVAGLDTRFEWSQPFPLALHMIGVILAVLAYDGLVVWSMAANAFFSVTVRIQEDRDHTVATGGPYRFVRHPGYIGAILFQVAVPLILGSVWAFIPCGLSALLFIVRTALEDETLQEELDGYKEYTKQTRYRLIPGIW